MKKIIIALLLISNVAVAQVGAAHTSMSITTTPNGKWVAVGQGQFGRSYEINVAMQHVRDKNNSGNSSLYRFRLNSMFHNEYFGFKKNASGVVHTPTGYMLDETELSDLNLTSEVPIVYEINLPIYNQNDSLAHRFGTIEYLFNPRVTSINFYDEDNLIIYNTLGIFVLKLGVVQNGKIVHKLSLIKSSEFTKVGELSAYYIFKSHGNGTLTVEKKRVKGIDNVVTEGTETITFKP